MAISRRAFIETVAATAGLAAVSSSLRAAAASDDNAKLALSAPLTHSDWMLKPGGPPWGEAGVRHMLDACKACGWSHVYWRVFDAGVATYKSKLLRPGDKAEADNYFAPQNDADLAIRQKFSPLTPAKAPQRFSSQLNEMDYAKFDSLAAAIEYGHKIGLKIHAWATINEDDHGWGWASEFTKAHPEFRWVRRDGKPYHSQLSFAFPEVRAYKLALIDELLTNYDLDGLFLDWIRTGDVRDNPQTDADRRRRQRLRTAEHRRVQSEVQQSIHTTCPTTTTAGSASAPSRKRCSCAPSASASTSIRSRCPIAVMVGHPWHYRGLQDPIDGNLRGLLLDVATWAKEGLMDAAIAAGYYRAGGDATKAYQALAAETAGQSRSLVLRLGAANAGRVHPRVHRRQPTRRQAHAVLGSRLHRRPPQRRCAEREHVLESKDVTRTGFETGGRCHPEQSKGSRVLAGKILRSAQNDGPFAMKAIETASILSALAKLQSSPASPTQPPTANFPRQTCPYTLVARARR